MPKDTTFKEDRGTFEEECTRPFVRALEEVIEGRKLALPRDDASDHACLLPRGIAQSGADLD